MKTVTYNTYGEPEAVLRVEDEVLGEPGEGEVVVKLLASPIHPSDFGMIGGTYGKLRPLPAVAGREGIGEVVAVGAAVEAFKEGMWVKLPENQGTWRQYCIVNQKELFLVPNDLPVEQAAMAFVNPATAWNLLHFFVELQAGDLIIQNAGNSALGYCVVQLAKYLGFKTVSIVRDIASDADLQAAGADFVFTEKFLADNKLEKVIGSKAKLGLNSVGGESAINLIKNISDGGTLVTFGGMSSDPVRFPTRYLIFNDIRLRGFWMDRWIRESRPEVFHQLFDKIFSLIREKVISIPVDQTFPLIQALDAVRAAKKPHRKGKILFVG